MNAKNVDNPKAPPPKVDPGAEAAEPSPGEKERVPEPSMEDLETVDRMYEDAAKKLADEAAAAPTKP